MSTVGTISKIATEVAGRTAHAVTHPVETVSSVTGRARRLAGAVVAGGRTREPDVAEPPSAAPASATPTSAAQPPPAQPVAPQEVADDWADELDDMPTVNPATGQPHRQQSDDDALLDPSLAKANRSEAEMMRKAAEGPQEG
ncbi:hypothetical protein [Nocardioides pelophilus]|uniref:hypothetical protein n=1 Tax=Nocardioides pelophilus TaxID=2172019 RepID=UPI001603A793|nr:hypothetical protein [Nocardioides pelophilus]